LCSIVRRLVCVNGNIAVCECLACVNVVCVRVNINALNCTHHVMIASTVVACGAATLPLTGGGLS